VDGAVWVRRVAPGSAAETAGIQPGDRILAVDGVAVDHAGQVIRAVRLHEEADPLSLTIERAGRRLQIRLRLPPRNKVQRAARDNGLVSRIALLPTDQKQP
jgi:S1-C subfamily serine protease